MSVATEEAQRLNTGLLKTEEDQFSSGTEITTLDGDVASLATLDTAAQEVAVTMMLDQSRQWLERAKASTQPAQDVAEFKAFVATVAEAAKQKKLSEYIQLDAVEMVRRSERALGIAIRDGQSAGQILSRGEKNEYSNQFGSGPRRDATRTSPGEFFAHNTDAVQTYAVVDGVSEEQFEVGLSIAKEEGNLSRRNVVKRVTEISNYREDMESKWEQIAEFASTGYTSAQVAKTFEMSEQHMRASARTRGISFPADKLTGHRRIDPLKVIENVVASIEASASALDLVTYEDVTPELAAELLERLRPGIKAIRQLNIALKEIN